MSHYENAPATRLVATACACCGKELVDAVSVETGVGPECRRRHGYASAQGAADWEAFRAAAGADVARFMPDGSAAEDARGIANRVVHAIALDQTGDAVVRWTRALSALGFTKMAARIAVRLGAVQVEESAGKLLVRTPYSVAFRDVARKIPGVIWDRAREVRTCPVDSRRHLWVALRLAFPGALVVGTRGVGVIQAFR